MSKEKLKAAFKMFDKDNSGTISKELRSYFVIVDKYIIFKLKGVSCSIPKSNKYVNITFSSKSWLNKSLFSFYYIIHLFYYQFK